MLSNYFYIKPSVFSNNFLVIPNTRTPRLVISLLNYSLFKTGLTLHNTASAKNKIIKKIILIGFPFYSYLKNNLIEPKENLIELLNILERDQDYRKLYFSSFYIGTAENDNRKITAQICDSEANIIGILKIPLAAQSEKFIIKEIETISSLKEYDFKSLVYPASSFLLSESPQKVVYQEDVFKDSKPIRNYISDIVFEASCELSVKTVSKNNDAYFTNLIQKVKEIKLDSTFIKLIIQTYNSAIEAKIPTVLIHGDYVKYNMKEKKDKLALIDWEFARIGLPLFDLFHFVFQGKIQIDKKSLQEAIDSIFITTNNSIFKKYLSSLKIDQVSVKQLFILYLCDMMIFEQNIKPGKDISESQFYKALVIMCYES